ncbi:MAG: gamma-glutamyl-gamma-aminobutyrate hydrolase family protein [Solirubrobacterales bacterium]|nr:gamma-glutamyl-gamma-aminobutyrate hydrolase family protein [Solirubrobacterales bacterium]
MSALVGIVAPVERARWSHWEDDAVVLPAAYVRQVQAAGGIPLVIAPDDRVAEEPSELVGRLDALILTGGADVDPASYGARPDPATGRTQPERDRFELALAYQAMEDGLPLLGICRGGQMINVACGGTLVQHLPDVVGDDHHLRTPGTFSEHEVELEAGSLAARAARADRVVVKSHHHQAVGELGEGLRASGHALPDAIVEAVEHPDHRYTLGVLWHPEADERSRIVESLVRAARPQVA